MEEVENGSYQTLQQIVDMVQEKFGKGVLDMVYSTDEEQEKRKRLQVELQLAAEAVQECIKQNAARVQDQEAYNAEYNRLADEYERAKQELADTEAAITEKAVQRDTVERFLEELGKQKEPLMDFDEDAWYGLVDHMEVKSKEDITVIFKDGTEVKA